MANYFCMYFNTLEIDNDLPKLPFGLFAKNVYDNRTTVYLSLMMLVFHVRSLNKDIYKMLCALKMIVWDNSRYKLRVSETLIQVWPDLQI